jgi:nuclear polyadenylated RNA-binding protein NAB2
MATISLDTPLADALSTAVHSRIVEEGWTQEDDTALAEYIVLMLANGKTQDQVASELAGELLQDAQGTEEFSKWLFDQVATLSGAGAGTTASAGANTVDSSAMQDDSHPDSMDASSSIPAAYEADMGDNAPDNAYVAPRTYLHDSNIPFRPRGPRGLHGGRASRGGRGGVSKPGDSVLHRTRGNDRINSHVRGAPKGPRNLQNQNVRPGMQKALNGMTGGPTPPSPNPMMPNGMPPGAPNPMNFTPEQQMQYLAFMEQQARLMAQFNDLQQGMGGHPNGGPGRGGFGGRGGSLFDRVERGRGGGRGRGRGGFQNGSARNSAADGDAKAEGDDASSAMDTDSIAQSTFKPNDPFTTMCHFNTRCTNKDCPYVHQSPAAPLHIQVDMTQTCNFGAGCAKPTCVARHPSPAQRKAQQAEEQCKFWPNCTKPSCPFKHPTMPLCSFGASCKTANCKFTHLQTPCHFNPCTNARCPYKHEAGQNRSFADYTWTPDSAKAKKEDESQSGMEHVSDRRFVSEDAGEEELIKPEANGEDGVEANGVAAAS